MDPTPPNTVENRIGADELTEEQLEEGFSQVLATILFTEVVFDGITENEE